MHKPMLKNVANLAFASMTLLAAAPQAHADVITDWNDKACAVVGKLGPGAPGHRAMAVVQSAVFEAVKAADARRGSLDAAVAAANRATLAALVPAEKPAIEAAYQAALAALPAGEATQAGLAAGEQAAAKLVERAAADGAGAPERYQWSAEPGRYVPTAVPAAVQWPARTPWVMDSAAQFRPGPPPELGSETWARDLLEVRRLGAKGSTHRTAGQTEAARFWEETRPLVYFPLLRAVAEMPGRSVLRNARLYAVAAQANDDALIAVFDAKYHYQFWRPVAAARTTHRAGSGTAEAESGWTPLVPTPLHPEYPCAHCVLAGAIAAVIEDEVGHRPAPPLRTTSPTLQGAVREWRRPAAMVDEVRSARIFGGVHYRSSTEVGARMGAAVGHLAQQRIAPAVEP